jgi:hypothetical protein
LFGSGLSSVEEVSLIILYCVVYTLPLIVIAAVFAVMGEPADHLYDPPAIGCSPTSR